MAILVTKTKGTIIRVEEIVCASHLYTVDNDEPTNLVEILFKNGKSITIDCLNQDEVAEFMNEIIKTM